jgi:hypothetical protein
MNYRLSYLLLVILGSFPDQEWTGFNPLQAQAPVSEELGSDRESAGREYRVRVEDSLDPLLRRPWISDLSAEEERLYFRLQKSHQSKPSFVIKQDSWGRNYKLKINGEIEYLLDESYIQKFPTQGLEYLGFAEAESLYRENYFRESAHLLKGIGFCYRLRRKGTKPSDQETKANLLLQKILNQNLDKKEEWDKTIDPYGCYTDKRLNLESEAFSYNLSLPGSWSWMYESEPEEKVRITDQFTLRFHRFAEERVNPKSSEDMGLKLKLAEQGLLKMRQDKIVFFIGEVFQKQPLLTADSFFQIWDIERGITKSFIREYQFRRKEKNPGYRSEFRFRNELGEEKRIVIREFYYWNGNQGIFLSFGFSSDQEERLEEEWKAILGSLKVRKNRNQGD